MNLHQRMMSRIRTRTELSEARLKLSASKAEYRNGGYSGHPEEKLEEIEHWQNEVDRLFSIVQSKTEIDYPALDKSAEELNRLYDRARAGSISRELKDQIEQAHQQLDELRHPTGQSGLLGSRTRTS